ncbi:MAG: hypothetical protein JNJ48_07350 [Phycisphaerae bacterium]|nr:hypothetical protein [Phycisphaerae bacterium]
MEPHPDVDHAMWDAQVRLRKGKPLRAGEWPSPAPLFVYDQRPPVFEDFPVPNSDICVASDPLRAFLEREAPGACEFLPIRIQGPGIESVPHRFWAINWIRVFDCLDPRSMEQTEDGPRVAVPVIDPSQIPLDGVLGLLGGYQVVRLIRNDLRLKLIRAGFTGLDYYSIAHRDGTDFLPFIRADGTIVLPDGAPADTRLPPPRPKSPKPHASRRTSRTSRKRK